MRNAPRFGWVLTVVSKTLAALDRGLAALDRHAPDRRTDKTNHHQERS